MASQPAAMGPDGDGAARDPNDGTRLIFPLVAEPSRRGGRLSIAVAGGLIGAVLVGAVVAAFSRLDQHPVSDGAAIETSRVDQPVDSTGGGRDIRLSVFELESGMCLSEITGDPDITYVPVVSCDGEHLAEVAATLRMPDGPWPGPAAVADFARDRCVVALRPVGSDASVDLRWTYFGPTETSWTRRDDRAISCLIVSAGGPLTESVVRTRLSPSSQKRAATVEEW